ncbi:hypothetical protein U14_03983 [Candidatus Moduliflexus flocculans]|uniref:Uncharacterized protein n=1 Tax=Candidatus Moduliflexus flocculans TaxID=1499966 RepID=A0A0S6VZP5_9BACT|nr:hypothetical protein U14_03983 [Candidatus Moduliflexus flocculans]
MLWQREEVASGKDGFSHLSGQSKLWHSSNVNSYHKFLYVTSKFLTFERFSDDNSLRNNNNNHLQLIGKGDNSGEVRVMPLFLP